MPDAADNLALRLLDAVHRTRGIDPGIVTDRYRAYRAAQGADAGHDGIRALLRTFEETGGSAQWAGKVGHYRRRYSPEDAPIAADTVELAADVLHRHGVDSVDDLAGTDDTTLADEWQRAGGDPAVWQPLLDALRPARALSGVA
ncbi:hypothetical protein QM787_04600 [Rhodococcus ruber]|uniref:Uncharacterized protein n=1 Tax=Rhodococcus ruber TaxID=1830 RepID=A0A098BVZ6_9NOCA|nr:MULTISPECIES: hypothetical protein [Rhodococcus]RIK09333.1 MAG: hypothetical protein DCC47_14255 [Acidobacteriota bacterium]MBP2210725.1 hypothetical protein [Rhodococcus ruber]MCD2127781.1 hypothetical protein [Rhodococcus ruber]MCF8783533.1 hypothetical protein [Rhodococcus ruber]MCZ1071634.1 hypothetical protein [Rhodococcus sp. A5(2022)]